MNLYLVISFHHFFISPFFIHLLSFFKLFLDLLKLMIISCNSNHFHHLNLFIKAHGDTMGKGSGVWCYIKQFEQYAQPQPSFSFLGKLFVVCYCLFHIVLALISGDRDLSLATTIMLISVTSYYMTSFINGSKNAGDVGLTWRCHLSNIISDIFYYSMGLWQLFFFKG